MGFNEGSIVLDNPNSIYLAGQTVHGTLEFNQDKLKKFRGIYVKMKGYCKVRWMSSHTRRINGQNQVQHEVFESNEIYFDRKEYLVGAESGEYQINAGCHKFSFSCHIPENCPSSYKGTHGEIAYEFNVVVDRPFKPDQHKKASFKVIAPLDLNADPYCRQPLSYEFEKTFCCSCLSSGMCEAVIKFPVAGFVPGQGVPMEVGCTNNSNVKIRSIKFTVIELVTFHAVNRQGLKHEREPLYEIKKGPIPGNTTKNWTVDVKLPIINFYNVNSCKYIDIEYIGKVTMKVSGCHSDLDQSKRIVIGTIPLIRYQEQTHNRTPMDLPRVILTHYETPIHPTDNTYRSQPPIINYPTPISTTNSPNPDIKSPSPIPKPPYPTTSPYPVVISPYPTTDALNKSSNSPYSPSNPPYPIIHVPYATESQSYPLSNNLNPNLPLPYPSEAPSPSANSPYPAAISPNSNRNSAVPYNTSNSNTNPPYPSTNSPYPALPLTINSPNPALISPHSTTSSSVPNNTSNANTNPSYPSTNSPYPSLSPAAHSPYPAAIFPHPTINSSVPNNTSNPKTNPSYPSTNSPYPSLTPAVNSPNPAVISLHSTINSSVPNNPSNPNTNSSYPSSKSPYPSVSPAANSPNPAVISPHATINSAVPNNTPNPDTNPPYPATNCPYPTTNSSCPNTNLPNSYTKSPYSVPNPPYPTTPTPNHPFPVAAEVQTSSNGPSMPPLPILATPQVKPNPYASASAPEPSTPVNDSGDIIYIPLNPPYNPEVYKS